MTLFKVNVDWRSRYFGLPTRAPTREPPSDAMVEWREQTAAAEEQELARHRAYREEVARRYRAEAEAEASARRAECDKVIRQAVERFGAAKILALGRRYDPAFELPSDLDEEPDTTQQGVQTDEHD